MDKKHAIKLFQEKKVRVHWDEEIEKWYFSIVDVIEVLTESPRPRKYWNALKTKLMKEGSELSHNMGRLKLLANDGKMRFTDVADTEQLLRLIQSIPLPKAEPFKLWLAKVGYERIEESEDLEKAFKNLSFRNKFRCFFIGMIEKSLNNICVNRFLTKNMFEMTFVN